MTEKRFTIKPSAIVDDVTVIIDNEKKYTFPVLDSTLNYMFCKAMNELAEENEQLKREVKRLDNLWGEKCVREYLTVCGESILKEMHKEKYGDKK